MLPPCTRSSTGAIFVTDITKRRLRAAGGAKLRYRSRVDQPQLLTDQFHHRDRGPRAPHWYFARLAPAPCKRTSLLDEPRLQANNANDVAAIKTKVADFENDIEDLLICNPNFILRLCQKLKTICSCKRYWRGVNAFSGTKKLGKSPVLCRSF